MAYDVVGAQRKRIARMNEWIKIQADQYSKLIDRCEALENELKEKASETTD